MRLSFSRLVDRIQPMSKQTVVTARTIMSPPFGVSGFFKGQLCEFGAGCIKYFAQQTDQQYVNGKLKCLASDAKQ